MFTRVRAPHRTARRGSSAERERPFTASHVLRHSAGQRVATVVRSGIPRRRSSWPWRRVREMGFPF